LLTNLAFHNDKESRKKAQSLIKDLRQIDSSAVVLAYWSALRTIEINDWGWFKKWAGSPKKEIIKVIDSLNVAIQKEQGNSIVRFIRANVSIEVSGHFPEFLTYAYDDLLFLDSQVVNNDEVRLFYIYLLWAKYSYWRGEKIRDNSQFFIAREYLKIAKKYACTSYYRDQIKLWNSRVNKRIK